MTGRDVMKNGMRGSVQGAVMLWVALSAIGVSVDAGAQATTQNQTRASSSMQSTQASKTLSVAQTAAGNHRLVANAYVAPAKEDGANNMDASDLQQNHDGLGHDTISLLNLQVSGRAAGPALPLSGDATAAAYKRYLDSFTHQVPEFFTEKIKDSSGS